MPPSYDNLIGNPFESKPDKPVTPNFGALAEVFLSQEDAERFRKLELANQPNKQSPLIRGPACNASLRAGRDIEGFNLESGMTADERAKFREAKELRETRNRLIKWAEEFNIGDDEWVDETFTFLPDGSAICKGHLFLHGLGITYFPQGIKEVHGDLDLRHNQITKIENLPASVGGTLDLGHNQITKIENLPASLGGNLYLNNNQITKIENLPASVGGSIYLNNNQITKIENLPASMGGDLNLSFNQITKIENLPTFVGISLYLSHNQITKIENLPASVGGYLSLSFNPAKQMQAGVNIGEKLWLSSDQTELIQDAKDKGYEVII